MSDRSESKLESKLDVFDDIVRKPKRPMLEPGSGVQRAPQEPDNEPASGKGGSPPVPPPDRPPAPAIAPRPRARSKPTAPPTNRGAIATAAPPRNAGAGTKLWMLAATGLVVLVALAVIIRVSVFPGSGTLVVSVSGPGGRVLPSVQTYVDGTRRCQTSPCRIEGLSRGVHIVEARAAGHISIAGKAVKVEAADEVPFDIELPLREAVDSAPTQNAAPRASAPLAKLEPAAPEAPAATPTPASSQGLPGDLVPQAVSSPARANVPPVATNPAASTAPGAEASPPAVASAAPSANAASATSAKLNLNSIPASNVVVDGRPLGQTPLIGVSVAPGTHSVVFIHPEHGRKVSRVSVEPGQTSTATAQFP